MEIPLTVFIFEFIQAILCFKSILVKKNVIFILCFKSILVKKKCNFVKKKVRNNEGLLSWSGNTRFNGECIDGVKQKLWGDLLSFQPIVGYGILTNINIFIFSLKTKFACEYITSILPCFARSIATKK